MHSWKTFLSRVVAGALVVGAAVAAGVFVGVRMASATPGGPTRDALTYSGVLNPAPGRESAIRLSFEFTHAPSLPGGPCTVAIPEDTRVAASGAFTVQVPLGGCPRELFDGGDVSYTVRQTMPTAEVLAADVPISPVPYARFADQAGVANACPAGYAYDAAASTGIVVCYRTIAAGRDEVVKVGLGASAFWVDRFEARVFDGMGRQYGASDANYPNLGGNGQWTAGARGSLQALSRAGGVPSARVTWFQASALCAAAGKSLLTREEWFLAADGLVAIDPPMPLNGNVAGVTGCNTGGTGARNAGLGTGCASSWGVQDMIGNVWEWTAEWYASVGQVTSAATVDRNMVEGRRVNDARNVWGADHGSDGTWNITSVVFNTAEGQIGIPSAAYRGGDWDRGAEAGVFALNLNYGPMNQGSGLGIRCVVRR